jgi:hypothetical protein
MKCQNALNVVFDRRNKRVFSTSNVDNGTYNDVLELPSTNGYWGRAGRN